MNGNNLDRLAAALHRDMEADFEMIADYVLNQPDYAKADEDGGGRRLVSFPDNGSHENDVLLLLWPDAGHDPRDGTAHAKAEYAAALWRKAWMWIRLKWMERRPKLFSKAVTHEAR